MSRLRAQLSRSEIDRKVATALSGVERTVLSTLQECHQYARSVGNPLEAARTKRVVRDLEKVLGALSGVRRVSPVYDADDKDLQSSEPTPKPKRPAPPPPTA
jgi:hypothetical protein